MKTIKQIADEIGVSKQAVSKRLSQLPPTEVSTADNGTKLVSPCGERILKELIKPTANQLPPTEPPTVDSVDSNIIKLLQDNMNVLQGQLAEKDKQIAKLTSALENTTASLHAAQLLHGGTMKQLTDGGDAEPSPTTAETWEEPEGIWARFLYIVRGY